MQRLFSMFPTGLAGMGLLLLRVSVSLSVVQSTPWHLAQRISTLALAGLALLTISICLGALTPLCAGLYCAIDLFSLGSEGAAGTLGHVAPLLNAAALVLLGPGAYSFDAKMFGRRRVIVASDPIRDNYPDGP